MEEKFHYIQDTIIDQLLDDKKLIGTASNEYFYQMDCADLIEFKVGLEDKLIDLTYKSFVVVNGE